ncbi:hypothetical protein PV328_002749 [Microctonus aethiopoides]|uniref:ubiquitinyl hydrolase 1 n=1 Tax=Microctonus aethiopoides TaxID=144406 RepID=A0AA39F723_9HYME|nr:hypothetical protein PV328_002749 [Microctonus aethiopoides]
MDKLMANQVVSSELGAISMIESSGSADLSDIPDLSEVSESTSLSPLTSSLDHTLTIQEDNVHTPDVKMGIENTWTEANCSASDRAIPLPPPRSLNDFVDVGADPMDDIESGVEHGPFLPPNSALNNIFTDTTDIQQDSMIDIPTPAGVCGLRNLGNTCFMAAGLQSLTATPPVLQHFLDLQQKNDKLPQPGSLIAHFSLLLSKMWSGRCSVVKPTEFKQTLGAYHSQFKDYRQHDCQEFLALLLDSLHEQMNTAKCAKGCQLPATITTANSINSNSDINDTMRPINAMLTASNDIINDNLMDTYDNSPSSNCSNSPNATMAGSPTALDFMALLNEDEETINPGPIAETNSSFIINKMHDDMDSEFDQEPLLVGLSPNRQSFDEYSKTNTQFHELYDIVKDAKTSNTNFLVTQPECNNEIHYDSQKFPKENLRRAALDNSNLTENHDFDNKTLSIKRIKEINVQKNICEIDCMTNNSDTECDNGLEKCNVKRMKLEEQQKNHRHNGLGINDNNQCLRTLQNGSNGALATQDEVEADKHWEKHLRSNQSVIVDTFQGQFKSTVVCAVCKHVSVTYEPFMYLSVPLPHAMERQLSVTYVPANNDPPVRCVVSLNKQSRIGKLKEELLKTLGKEDLATNNVAIAEVLENHISRILDDNASLRHANDTIRSIYAFELTDPPDAYTSTSECGNDALSEAEPCQNGMSNSEEITSCAICLDEVDVVLKKHDGNNCNFTMCEVCLETYFKNPESKNCPACNVNVERSSFTKIDQSGHRRPVIRILNVPLVLRYDTNEAPNNRKSTKLFGYPHLLRLPSRVNAKDLHEILRRIVPHQSGYTVLFVDGQGGHCSRCLFAAHCTGCVVPETGVVVFQTSDNLAVRYMDDVPKIVLPIDHISVSKQRPHHPLSLYDCLQAFSQSEMLDEHNPWFCPKCEQNQCATKTLTVHRYPKYLIVYLKRFVFHECVSMKLDDRVAFPLAGLNVGRHLYDLYACVCHYGGVSAGHYTAYAKNPQTDIWYHYNDEVSNKQKPQEEDFSNAYILFYCRQGTNTKLCNI